MCFKIIFNCVSFLVFCIFIGGFQIQESTAVQTAHVVNERPIIGILAQEVFENNNSEPNGSYIAASYVKFIEGAGAQVVPILINKNETYLREIFGKINGILFPGGSVPFSLTKDSNGFVQAGHFLLKLAKEANDKGDYFPVWGTCLGFEFMIYDEAKGQEIRANCGAWNVRDKLKYTKDASESALYGKAPKFIVNTLATQTVTVNFHHFCVTPENFTKFGLDKGYKSLSINYDPSANLTYVSSIEHRKYPFFAVQFHPEKNIYEWNTKEFSIPHSPDAIQSAQYFATFFVNQARRNSHHFSTVDEENKYLIYNYSPVFSGADGSTFIQKYLFNY